MAWVGGQTGGIGGMGGWVGGMGGWLGGWAADRWGVVGDVGRWVLMGGWVHGWVDEWVGLATPLSLSIFGDIAHRSMTHTHANKNAIIPTRVLSFPSLTHPSLTKFPAAHLLSGMPRPSVR